MARLYTILLFALLILAMPVESAAASPSKNKQLQQSKEDKTEALTSKIEALRKTQHDLDTKLSIASKIEEAKWDLFIVFVGFLVALIILVIGSGVGVFFAVTKYLQARLDREIQERGQILKRELEENFEYNTKALNARIWGNLGLRLTELLKAYDQTSTQWETFWKVAEDQARRASKIAEEMPEDEPLWEERNCIYKNNLAFLLIIRGDLNDREEVIRFSKYVYERSSKYSVGYHYEDTYGWTLLVFAQNQQERNEAVKLLETLYKRPELPQGWVESRRAELLRKITEDFRPQA